MQRLTDSAMYNLKRIPHKNVFDVKDLFDMSAQEKSQPRAENSCNLSTEKQWLHIRTYAWRCV